MHKAEAIRTTQAHSECVVRVKMQAHSECVVRVKANRGILPGLLPDKLKLVRLTQDLIIRPSASLISELSIAGSPLLADPPVQLMTSPGFTVSCVQP